MKPQRFILAALSASPTINSQGRLTDEYGLRFLGGASGRGSAPLGETRSRYEATAGSVDSQSVLERLAADGIIGRELCQAEFDDYLASHSAQFGPGPVFSLSCAFFEATLQASAELARPAPAPAPRFCLNILNGGKHAYTNPVLSDFHEFLLVPKHGDMALLLDDHRAIQAEVRSRLAHKGTTRVNGNVVHVLGENGNRDCIGFLVGIVEGLGLSARYELMVDAAAAQLWNGSAYALELAEKRNLDPQAFEEYWLSVLGEYPVAWLEDPFAEHDLQRWRRLVTNAAGCRVVGDDVHSGDAARVQQLLATGCMTGVVLKPDQAGTISETLAALEISNAAGVPVILSHRSISTDSLVLAHLMAHCDIKLAKFGPLLSDFTSILRMNEVLRMTREERVLAGSAEDGARNELARA